MRFKRNKVWVAMGPDEVPLVQKGKVLIKYQLDQPHEYWVHADSVHELNEPSLPNQTLTPEETICDDVQTSDTITIFTDGACSGNPGPAGIGVVMMYRGHRKEISQSIGMATNNKAELEAIRIALEAVKNRALPVVLYTDSRYAWGLLTQGWKAQQNHTTIERIRSLSQKFQNLKIIKIKGHAGHPENERADRLAVKAVEKEDRPKMG